MATFIKATGADMKNTNHVISKAIINENGQVTSFEGFSINDIDNNELYKANAGFNVSDIDSLNVNIVDAAISTPISTSPISSTTQQVQVQSKKDKTDWGSTFVSGLKEIKKGAESTAKGAVSTAKGAASTAKGAVIAAKGAAIAAKEAILPKNPLYNVTDAVMYKGSKGQVLDNNQNGTYKIDINGHVIDNIPESELSPVSKGGNRSTKRGRRRLRRKSMKKKSNVKHRR